jgi:hypothetical protein
MTAVDQDQSLKGLQLVGEWLQLVNKFQAEGLQTNGAVTAFNDSVSYLCSHTRTNNGIIGLLTEWRGWYLGLAPEIQGSYTPLAAKSLSWIETAPNSSSRIGF